MIRLLALLLLLEVPLAAYGNTWSAAHAYRQKLHGQKVIVKAMPFKPFSGSPMHGNTKVFYRHRLLYVIDSYFRESIYTSDNGRYLVVVHSSNTAGITSNGYEIPFRKRLNFRLPALTIYKDGKVFRIVTQQEVLDTANIPHQGWLFDWSYYFDEELAYKEAGFGCDACKEVYGRKVLKSCDTTEIEPEECIECRQECDSAELAKTKRRLAEMKAYMQDNVLFVLTCQNTIIRLDFSTLTVERLPFADVIPDKKKFFPQKMMRKYQRVKYSLPR